MKDSSKEEVKDRPKKKKEKVVITGDDILIEYVRRIKHAVKKTREVVLRDTLLLQSG